MPQSLAVSGLCRFSYPSPKGFSNRFASHAERVAFLYEPTRLAHRLMTFEQVTLPALARQTDPDFTLFVLVGTDLPRSAFDRLRDLTGPIAQIRIVALEPMHHMDAAKRVFAMARTPDSVAHIQFRLDDDDAISTTFVQSLREDFPLIAPAFHSHGAAAIDYTEGYILGLASDQLRLAPCSRHGWAPGLAIALHPQTQATVMHTPHMQVYRAMPCLSLPRPDSFVRGHSPFNDSRIPQAHKLLKPLNDKDANMLFQSFAINAQSLLAAANDL
jgi:hypothetical protein